MRTSALVFIGAIGLFAGSPAVAGGDGSVFVDGAPILVAHETSKRHEHDRDDRDDRDDRLTREEIREEERELRERKRELREEERELRRREARRPLAPRIWVGVGTGIGFASFDIPDSACSFNSDCTHEESWRTYNANVTFSGPRTALRFRGIRDADKGSDQRTPYEQAVLIGSRFGRSNWYGMVGAGRIRHADDKLVKDVNGFAWEILFAPSSEGGTGLELSFQGNTGSDVD